MTDTERIAVVPDDRGPRAQVFARRLHNESCAKYVADYEREELRKEKAIWDKQQQRKGTRGRGL